MKLTHPCKETCSGYSQDCAEQVSALQARVKDLEAEVARLRAVLKQCRVYSECYDELIQTIDEALAERLPEDATDYQKKLRKEWD